METPANHSSSKSRLVTIRGACERLSLGRTTVYGLLRSGDLEARKIGRRTMISVESIEALVKRVPVARFAAPIASRVRS